MTLTTIGRETCLTPFRRKEAVAKVLQDRNALTSLVEDHAISKLLGENEALEVLADEITRKD